MTGNYQSLGPGTLVQLVFFVESSPAHEFGQAPEARLAPILLKATSSESSPKLRCICAEGLPLSRLHVGTPFSELCRKSQEYKN